MDLLPDTALVLVPGGTLITATPEEGRALALLMARHTIHNIQPDLERPQGRQAEVRFEPGQSHRRQPGGRDRISDDRRGERLLAKSIRYAGGHAGAQVGHLPPRGDIGLRYTGILTILSRATAWTNALYLSAAWCLQTGLLYGRGGFCFRLVPHRSDASVCPCCCQLHTP